MMSGTNTTTVKFLRTGYEEQLEAVTRTGNSYSAIVYTTPQPRTDEPYTDQNHIKEAILRTTTPSEARKPYRKLDQDKDFWIFTLGHQELRNQTHKNPEAEWQTEVLNRLFGFFGSLTKPIGQALEKASP
jgi:hypothetical protein